LATTHVLGNFPRGDRVRGDKSDKNRFSGGENEASAGGDEKPTKDVPKQTPKDDQTKD
jgi:hypothetical protein